jgi:glutathione S-transferase
MKARLFQFLTSPFSAKARKLLEYKGLDFEIIEIDYIERRELLIASGQIMVPVVTMENGETVVGSDRIAIRLEELYPEPTIFPPGLRGIHIALERYIDSAVSEAVYPASIPDKVAHFRRQGADREAMWRLSRERKYGAGFVDRAIAEHRANLERATAILAPFEEQLGAGAFLTSRIGLADFALYGQLYNLGFTGTLKLPASMPKIHAFYGRMDRISAAPEPPTQGSG